MQKANKFLPLSRPEISKETIDDVVKVLESGWLATGPFTQKFEQKLSEYFEGRKTACFTSATAGLQASLMAIGVKPGDEVITTPLTFVCTANVIAMLGAKPVLVDIDRNTFNIDVRKIAERCTSKTKAIVPVHYAGLSVDLDEVYAIAQEKNLRVIEDAAHAVGSEYKGRKIGTFGDIQVFSFHPIKNMTSGEGGCVTLNSEEELKFLGLQRFHGIDRSIWDRFSKNGSCYYDVVMPGFKSNMSDIQAAIGLHQLQEVDEMNERRRYLSDRYRAAFSDMDDKFWMQGIPSYDFVHSGHLFPVCLRDASLRDNFMSFLKENSIGTTPYYTPLHLFTYYQQEFGYKKGDYPEAEYIGERIVSLPLYTALQESEQDYIIEVIRNFFK
ncbi:MAG: DegT/DnrJ/EryC1/StrS aminotransferase family protein [Alphaproteobacteria bacterium]|nr:DegT/DnrJ/EryC1/StrS aminotransferase family protein [Alphaproteobacteria bacterium]